MHTISSPINKVVFLLTAQFYGIQAQKDFCLGIKELSFSEELERRGRDGTSIIRKSKGLHEELWHSNKV